MLCLKIYGCIFFKTFFYLLVKCMYRTFMSMRLSKLLRLWWRPFLTGSTNYFWPITLFLCDQKGTDVNLCAFFDQKNTVIRQFFMFKNNCQKKRKSWSLEKFERMTKCFNYCYYYVYNCWTFKKVVQLVWKENT